MNKQQRQHYADQLEYATEQVRIWSHLPLEDRVEQIESDLKSQFGYVEPGVISETLSVENMI